MSNENNQIIDFSAIGQSLGQTFFIEHEFIIPRYQRPYEWKKEQLEEFWSDLVNNKNTYFIGNLIFNTSNLQSKNQMEIIDGQQRLLTITIFYSAIYNIAKDICKVTASDYYSSDIKCRNTATLEDFSELLQESQHSSILEHISKVKIKIQKLYYFNKRRG